MLDHGQRQSNGSPEMAAVVAPGPRGRDFWGDGPARVGAPLTYTIPHYPVHLIDVVRMADASRVIIRPTLPQDAELQRDFFRALSAESRYGRFITPFIELPENMAQRFASIDYHSHLALLAEVFVGGRQTMIGEARYIVDECDPTACEFAIAVADVWQFHGLARILLDRLERQAAASGIQRMVADTLSANRAMIGLAAQAGYAVRASREDAMLASLEKRLAPSAAPLP
jgi:acetyltransferase